MLQSGICRAVHRVTDLEKIPVQISKDEADVEQQAHSMIPKTERYTDTLKQALTRQRQKSNTKPTTEKAVKKRDCAQLSVARKDQTTNAGGKRKMAAIIRQANS